MPRLRSALRSSAVLLAACAGSPRTFDELPPALRETTVVAVREPDAVIPDSATCSLMPGSFVRLDDRYDANRVERQIVELLDDGLRRRGLYLVPDGRGALWIGYAIAVEGALHGHELDRAYGLDRQAPTRDHERGALVVDVVDRASRRPLWRGSVAILTDPTLPEDLRRERVANGVERLLDALKGGY